MAARFGMYGSGVQPVFFFFRTVESNIKAEELRTNMTGACRPVKLNVALGPADHPRWSTLKPKTETQTSEP